VALKAEVATLKACPPLPADHTPVSVPVTITTPGLSHEEAAIFKAEVAKDIDAAVQSSIAVAITKFEAMITNTV
jgi:hypothetical protein